MGFPGVSDGKENLPTVQETWVWSLGCKDPLEKGMVTHSSILVWRIPMDRGARWAIIHRVAKSQHNWVTNFFCFQLLENIAYFPMLYIPELL